MSVDKLTLTIATEAPSKRFEQCLASVSYPTYDFSELGLEIVELTKRNSPIERSVEAFVKGHEDEDEPYATKVLTEYFTECSRLLKETIEFLELDLQRVWFKELRIPGGLLLVTYED